MRTSIAFLLVVIFFAKQASCQTTIQNIDSRSTTSLNGKWNYLIDPYETGITITDINPTTRIQTHLPVFFLIRNQKTNGTS